ncbi:MAG: hypothetical protein IRY84_12845 [Thermobispora bispora]|nr:hypothetical protein [Thermobispora bispora]
MTRLSPEELRRMQNKARFWNERIRDIEQMPEGEKRDSVLAQACFDRARAAARLAQRGGDGRAMRDLAMLLTTWAEQQEKAHIRRHTQ